MTNQLGLTNEYVTKLCETLTGSYFIGTLPCDYLVINWMKIKTKLLKNIPFAIIVNLSPSTHEGSHFITLTYRDES